MARPVIERIKGSTLLPSLPTVALRLMDLVRRDAPVADIAKVISADPALTSRLLRTVNSSFYRRSHTVSTVAHAITVLGVVSVKTIVLGFSLVQNLKKQQTKGFDHLKYWRHSLYSATAARVLAERFKIIQKDECFLAALLADIGMLALDKALGEEYGRVQKSVSSHAQLEAAEKKALDLTHAQVSGILAAEWKLPRLLAVPMACHHGPSSAPDVFSQTMSALVSAANRFADIFTDEDTTPAIQDARSICQTQFALTAADCDELLALISTQAREQAPLFEITIDGEIDLPTILAEANQTLVDLMLRSEQQAKVLVAQNQELLTRVNQDVLTGLANRTRFEQFLAQQFRKRDAAPLSLILLDLDGFKSINDNHGHPAGDAALISTGRALAAAARQGDLAARTGGDEFALILPQTDAATAQRIAMNICSMVSGSAVSAEDLTLSVSLSAGVATNSSAHPFDDSQALVRAADASLYSAKAAGRNCVRVFEAATNKRRVA
ncbi:MAG TPA: GGDEF domain-containing protein [Tepidisphaeraceae bacterium]|jgi:diguanylate cyclase (GGDEF)-like protein|nr:GGDEF domain-containing protein [Tepidisphaeraceae bacterium]